MSLLEEFYSTILLSDAPHIGYASVKVASGDTQDAQKCGEYQYCLKDVGDEDSLDATYGRVEGANQADQHDAHVPWQTSGRF